MGIRNAHALENKEIAKYNSIDSTSFISIAEFISEPDKEPLCAFQHAHDEYEFIIPVETIPLMRYEKANYIGEVGYVYPVNPYVNHGLEFDLEKDSHVISIAINRAFLEQRKALLGYDNKYFYTRFLASKDLLIGIEKFQKAAREEYLNKKVLEMLAKGITDLLIIEGLASGEDNRRPEKVYARNIKKVLIYMFENYRDQELTINKLAEISGYSPAYFSRAFKAYIHDAPIVHLNKLRLSEARALFKNKDLTIGEIATRVGYKNLSTFTEAFKNIIGMKPKKYRDKYC